MQVFYGIHPPQTLKQFPLPFLGGESGYKWTSKPPFPLPRAWSRTATGLSPVNVEPWHIFDNDTGLPLTSSHVHRRRGRRIRCPFMGDNLQKQTSGGTEGQEV